MSVIEAPNFVNDRLATVFLAGSIELGAAEKWQERVVQLFGGSHWTILNPRREDWDSTWEQSVSNPKFVEQVQWELQGIEQAEYVIIYFDPATKSPISLLELGFLAGSSPDKVIVVCPTGFYRKGNVDLVCDRYRIKKAESLERAVEMILFNRNSNN